MSKNKLEKGLSQLDPGGVLKSAHQDENNSLRVTSANTSVPPNYSKVDITYNASNSVSNAVFYDGTRSEITCIEFTGDFSGSLNNKYFVLYSEYDKSKYYVWYNVSGAGVDPSLPDAIGLEVPIITNDQKEIVTLATKLVLNNIYDFDIEVIADIKLKITNKRKGPCTDTTDFGTGFSIVVQQQGSHTLIKEIKLEESSNYRYIYNKEEKKFEVESLAGTDELQDINLELDQIRDNQTNRTQYTRIIDENGNDFTQSNPLPVELSNGSVNIGTVNAELEVQLSHKDNNPDVGDVADSVQRGDGVNIEKVDRLSIGNSTSTPLGISGTFTGAWEEVLGWSTITVLAFADQVSDVDGLQLQFSSDGVNIDDIDNYTIPVSNGKPYSVGVTSRYFRVVYNNNTTTAQTEFRLQTIYHVAQPKPSSHRIDDNIQGQDDAELVKSILTGKSPDGIFINKRTGGIFSDASTSTPLGISGIYTSPAIDITEFAQVNVSVFSDQDSAEGGISFQFSHDGINWYVANAFKYETPNFRRFQYGINGKYFRVVYTNGLIAQTDFSLQVILLDTASKQSVHRIGDTISNDRSATLTKSVLSGEDPFGTFNNVKTSYYGSLHGSLNDWQTGAQTFVAPNGSINVSELVRLVGGNFVTGQPLLPHIWNEVATGSGSTNTNDGELIISTGTTANSSIGVQSFRKARFITATFNMSHLAVSTPGWDNLDVIRRWGIYNPNDASLNGVYLENNSGVYSIVRVKNNIVVETVPEINFNGQNTLIKNDNVAIYEFLYNAGTIFVLQNRRLIHRMQSLDSAAYGEPHLKAGHYIENINGNTVDNTIVTRGASISRIGAGRSQPLPYYIAGSTTTLIKNSPGRLLKILITDQGTGSTNIIVYNNTIAAGEVLLNVDTSDIIGGFDLDVEFDVGLTVVTNGGATIKTTVIYD